MPKFDEEFRGEGIIRLKTYKEGDKIYTSSEFDFKNISTAGAISELEKVIKRLKEDMPKQNLFEKLTKNAR